MFCSVLEIELRALYMLGKHCITELYPESVNSIGSIVYLAWIITIVSGIVFQKMVVPAYSFTPRAILSI